MKKNNFNKQAPIKMIKCSCGGEAKLIKRKNYPFGRNSKSKIFTYFMCKSCNKRHIPTKNIGGKNGRI